EALECWPDSVQKRIIESKFPNSLLISHTYNAYTLVRDELEKIQSVKRRQAEEKVTQRRVVTRAKTKGKGKAIFDSM
ncbi:5398_t:CDS:2, partial [Acaulospora morrowiae]